MSETDVMSSDMWTKKVGPLPMWAWAGAIGGGLGYFMYRNRKDGEGKAVAPVAGASDTGFGTTSPGVGGYAQSPGMPVPMTTTPADNHAWSTKAQNLLVAMGFDPGTVATALSNYLGGNALSAQQTAIVSEALRSAGPTPEPVPPAAPPVPEVTSQTQAPLEQGVFGVGYGPLTKEFWTSHTQDDAMTAISGDRYSWLPGAAAVKAAQVSGQTTYYQPAPGVFAPTTGFTAAQWKNTPIFVKA